MFIWYVTKDGEFVGMITRDEPDSFGMRAEARTYVDCMIWLHVLDVWWNIPANESGNATWMRAEPVPCLVIANMLKD